MTHQKIITNKKALSSACEFHLAHLSSGSESRQIWRIKALQMHNNLQHFLSKPACELYEALAPVNNELVDAVELMQEDTSDLLLEGQIQREITFIHMLGRIAQNGSVPLDATKQIRQYMQKAIHQALELKELLSDYTGDEKDHASAMLDKLKSMVSDLTKWEQSLYDFEISCQELDEICFNLNEFYLQGQITPKTISDKYSTVGKNFLSLHEQAQSVSERCYSAIRLTEIMANDFEDIAQTLLLIHKQGKTSSLSANVKHKESQSYDQPAL